MRVRANNATKRDPRSVYQQRAFSRFWQQILACREVFRNGLAGQAGSHLGENLKLFLRGPLVEKRPNRKLDPIVPEARSWEVAVNK